MSDYASIVERARRSSATVSKIEAALTRAPEDPSLQINLSAAKKLSQKAHDALLGLSRLQHKEVCSYRLIPSKSLGYAVASVSKSMLEYQNLFSQLYDCKRNGKKKNAAIGKEAAAESALQFAYSFSGSLGVVMFAQSEADFFEGNLDSSIEAFFSILDIDDVSSAKRVADSFGGAVIKRIHDWSASNIEGGFSADVQWNKSDGRIISSMFDMRKMERIVETISSVSDEESDDIYADGIFIGGDLDARTFHFIIPQGASYRGTLSKEFDKGLIQLGGSYSAHIVEKRKTFYATERTDKRYELVSLRAVSTK